MNYSKIKSIDIKNFRCLEHVHIDFDKSPIICLSANNDSGKSSVVKAIQNICFNNNSRKNKGYVRTGTSKYEISISLEDGTQIQRAYGTCNLYRILDANGNLVKEWTKLDGDIPAEVANIFGMFVDEETGELLNIRTCESLLLFALTKGSENHKIFYSKLKVDEISSAMELGKTRMNELTTLINNTAYARDADAGKIKTIRIPEMSGIEQLKERINENANKLSHVSDIMSAIQAITDTRNKMTMEQQAVSNLQEINEEDAARVSDMAGIIGQLTSLNTLRVNFESIRPVVDVQEIDSDKLNTLEKLGDAITKINELANTNTETFRKNTEALNTLCEIDSSKLDLAGNIMSTLQNLTTLRSQLEVEQNELARLKEEMSSVGIYVDVDENSIVTKCANCGEENRLHLDLIERACEQALSQV